MTYLKYLEGLYDTHASPGYLRLPYRIAVERRKQASVPTPPPSTKAYEMERLADMEGLVRGAFKPG